MKKCTICGESKPEEDFRKQKGRKTRRANCKSCDRDRHKDWSEKNKEHLRSYNNSRWVNTDRWDKHIKRRYGITEEIYEEMLAKQNGGCAVCRSKISGGNSKRFHIDHCHKTGKIRGLLCSRCNKVLGQVNDDVYLLKQAAQYLLHRPVCAAQAQGFIEAYMEGLS